MNDLIYNGSGGETPPTMSSKEIAQLCEKRHGDVLRDIRTMLDALGDDADLRHVVEDKDSRGYTKEFLLPKDLTLTLVAGYNIQLRHRIVKRLEEIEARPADPMVMLNDNAWLRGTLLSYTEKVAEMQGQIEEMRPSVQALERIAVSDGSLCITDAAKNLQVQPKALFNYLREHRWIYSRPGSAGYVAYQDKLQSGLLEHKVTVVTRADGSEKTTTQVRVTAKGMARLAKLFPPVAEAA